MNPHPHEERAMNIQITSLTEPQVEAITEALDQAGFRYEEDYEALYTGPWILSGLTFYGLRALDAQKVVAQVLRAA